MILVGTPVHRQSVHGLDLLLRIWSTWDISCHFLVVFNGPLAPFTISDMHSRCRAYPRLSIRTHVMPTGYRVPYDALTNAQNFIRHVALSGNYSHLLLNEVTRIPVHSSPSALLSAGKLVVGALFRDSHKPGYYCVYDFDGIRHRFDGYRSIDRIKEPTPVKGMGFGFILIARDALKLRPFRSARYASDTYFGCDMSDAGIPLFACPTFVDNVKIDHDSRVLGQWNAMRKRILMLPRYHDDGPLAVLNAEVDRSNAAAIASRDEVAVFAAATGNEATLRRVLSEEPKVLTTLTGPGSWYGPGYTLLHIASGHGQSRIVKYLLSRGMQVNVRGGRGLETPLHWASQFGSINGASVLTDAGADPLCRSAFGITPIQVARWFNHDKLMDVLTDSQRLSGASRVAATRRPPLRLGISRP